MSNISDYRDRKTIYKKGSPIHVRGSLLYNKIVKDAKLTKKYELIQNANIIVQINLLSEDKTSFLKPNQIFIGVLNPYENKDQLNHFI